MTPWFNFDVDPDRNIVKTTIGGFFDVDDVRKFVSARREALRALTCPLDQHLSLVDVRQMAVQSQDVVMAFKAFLDGSHHRSGKLAVVVGTSLGRTQMKRAAANRSVQYFSSMDDAEAWLFAERVLAA